MSDTLGRNSYINSDTQRAADAIVAVLRERIEFYYDDKMRITLLLEIRLDRVEIAHELRGNLEKIGIVGKKRETPVNRDRASEYKFQSL